MGLTYSSVIEADRDEVFSWHTRPGAITRLIPPWQPVRVLREAGSLRDGRATLTLPGGGGGHAGDRRDRDPAPRPDAAVRARLPAPAARRRPGRAGPGPRYPARPRPADGGGHRLQRPDRHRADRAADHQRAPGRSAGAPAAPGRGTLLATGGSGRGAARRG